MPKIAPSLFAATLILLGLVDAPAQAQLSRTFVSAARGNDANNCDRATPCRTFQAAHDKTNSDGEVTVLDPGGYGALRITKSISVVNDGVGEASILVSGDNTGIIVDAPAAAYVNLRGITIQGIGFGGGSGLRFDNGFALTITNCVVRNLTRDGIILGTQNGTHSLSVSDTLVADNGGGAIGIVPDRAVVVKVAISRVRMYNNKTGGVGINTAGTTGTVDVSIVDSIAANSIGFGFSVFSFQGAAATTLTVLRSVSANNNIGLSAQGSGAAGNVILRVGQSTVTGNRFNSWIQSVGTVLRSYGDNQIDGNGDGDPAPTKIPTK